MLLPIELRCKLYISKAKDRYQNVPICMSDDIVDLNQQQGTLITYNTCKHNTRGKYLSYMDVQIALKH